MANSVCDIDPDLLTVIKKFRFRQTKENAAIIMKIDRATMVVKLDEELENCSIEELQEALPEHQPRYVLFIYRNELGDGRVAYPMCFIFISPSGCKPELMMMYAGTRTAIVSEAQLTKVFELRSVEELTEEWLKGKLARLT
ncbi:PREDICTED: glia maturation factor beta-like isoform X2 [Priapulus caudatus]|uniref:Glia maturation factor beta-like isoform X1 n=1 Tax=Priapulus caudatus TaxID=37621 RepID=A0ABM1F5C2_PRICU|nr:PREDICTED: glia maturation factor beta-like isoform X1 [Priapulus caudatus]XP_014679643.1 PREDICTED: glia maturation factor beta-like isoform X2 [Priapulus caudatus]